MTVVTALAGTRWGLLVSLLGATVAGASAGLASGFTGLIVARLLLGVFSGGLLPAAVQAVREWFPSRMRTLAIALVFAAGQLAAFLSQVLFTETTIGWRTMTFVSGLPTAIAAILCILLWPARTPREPSRRVSGRAILWAAMLAVGLLLVAPVFQFVTVRLPSFSRQRLGIDAVDMKTAAAVPLLASLCGAVLAGALAWAMMSNGGRTARTRAVLLTVSGILLLPVAVTGYISQWPFILVLMAVCSMAFGAWSTLLYAAVADTLPARGVAIAAAIGGLMGTVSGLLVSTILNHASAAGIEILPFGMAATAAVALLAVALPAWLIRPEPD
jgi:MFS family permease